MSGAIFRCDEMKWVDYHVGNRQGIVDRYGCSGFRQRGASEYLLCRRRWPEGDLGIFAAYVSRISMMLPAFPTPRLRYGERHLSFGSFAQYCSEMLPRATLPNVLMPKPWVYPHKQHILLGLRGSLKSLADISSS